MIADSFAEQATGGEVSFKLAPDGSGTSGIYQISVEQSCPAPLHVPIVGVSTGYARCDGVLR